MQNIWSGNKELEETSQGQMPDSKIVNQMIIAMDYGKPKTHVDLGIVLFADKDTYPVTIEKNDSNKKIHFRKMHPENNIELELEEIKKHYWITLEAIKLKQISNLFFN